MKTVFITILTATMIILMSAGSVYAGQAAKLTDDSIATNDTSINDGDVILITGQYDNGGGETGNWIISINSTDINTVDQEIDNTCDAGDGFKFLSLDTSGCTGTCTDLGDGRVDVTLTTAQDNQVIKWTIEACSDASNQDPYTITTELLAGNPATLNANTDPITVNPAAGDNPPYYNTTSGYLGVNDTTPNPGDTVQYYSWWYDDTALSNYTLEWNETGSWINQTWQNSPGNNTWHNYTIQVPAGAEGKFISAKIWANDSQNQFNSTTLVNITVQNVAPTVSNTAVNDTEVGKNEFICINATATDVGVGIDDVWAMVTYPNGTEINATMSDTGPACSGGDDWYGVNFNVGDTGGTLYVNTTYANDTLGNESFQDPFPDVAVTVLTNVSFKITFLNGSGVISSPAGTQGLDQNITADNGSHKYADPCLKGQIECQTSSLGVLRFNNTGDTATNWSVRLNQSLPSSIVLWGSKDSDPDTNIQLISDTAWTIINTSVCVNCEEEFWIWANFTDAAIADEITLRLNNTANDF